MSFLNITFITKGPTHKTVRALVCVCALFLFKSLRSDKTLQRLSHINLSGLLVCCVPALYPSELVVKRSSG